MQIHVHVDHVFPWRTYYLVSFCKQLDKGFPYTYTHLWSPSPPSPLLPSPPPPPPSQSLSRVVAGVASPWPMVRLDVSRLKAFKARRKWHVRSKQWHVYLMVL